MLQTPVPSLAAGMGEVHFGHALAVSVAFHCLAEEMDVAWVLWVSSLALVF